MAVAVSRSAAQLSIAARLDRLPVVGWHRRLTAVVGVGVFYEYVELFLGGVLLAVLRDPWQLSVYEGALLIGSVYFGMAAGSYLLAPITERFGRRKMFVVNLSIYLVCALLAAMAPNVWVLIALRFVAGIGAGAEAVLVNTYLGEILPKEKRGRYIGVAITIGFAAYPVVALAGAPLARAEIAGVEGWRWLLALAGSGIVLLLWLRRNLPESPRWLASRGELDRADAEITRIEAAVEREYGRALPEPELEPKPAGSDTAAPVSQGRTREIFQGQVFKRFIAVASQSVLGGIGYYGFSSLAPVLLVAKGYTVTQSLLYTGLVAIGYPVGSGLSAYLMGRFERKTVIIVATSCAAVLGLGFAYASNAAMLVAAGFCLSLSSNLFSAAAHAHMSEVFPQQVRTRAMGLAYGSGRIAAGILPLIGLPLLDWAGALAVMSMSAVTLIAVALITAAFSPRTQGRSLEDVAADR